jgi:membrane protein
MTSDSLLYITVIIISTCFAFLSQRVVSFQDNNGAIAQKKVNYIGFYIISFLILAFFSCSIANGIDKDAYRFLFRENTISNIYEGVEPGFWLFIIVVKIFTNNENVFLGIVSFLTVFFTFNGVWKCRDKLSVGFAIFIYASQYYLQSFNLMRMYLSMSILVLGSRNILDCKPKVFLLYILVASSIHFSALFVLVGYLMSFVLMQRKKKISDLYFIFLIIASIVVSILTVGIAAQFAEFDFSGKYSTYLSETTTGTVGFKVILNIFPYFLVMYLCKLYNENKWLIATSEGFCVAVLFISIMSYSVPVIGRSISQFSIYIIILLPTCLYMYRKGKLDDVRWKNKKDKYYIICFVLFLYFTLLLFLYLRDYMELDGIDNCKFIWQ